MQGGYIVYLMTSTQALWSVSSMASYIAVCFCLFQLSFVLNCILVLISGAASCDKGKVSVV